MHVGCATRFEAPSERDAPQARPGASCFPTTSIEHNAPSRPQVTSAALKHKEGLGTTHAHTSKRKGIRTKQAKEVHRKARDKAHAQRKSAARTPLPPSS